MPSDGTFYDHYTVVSPEAGAWRCERCWMVTASPSEHEARCEAPISPDTALEAPDAQ